jgi:hypothetical protein
MLVLVALLSGRSRLRSARYAVQVSSLVNIERDGVRCCFSVTTARVNPYSAEA